MKKIEFRDWGHLAYLKGGTHLNCFRWTLENFAFYIKVQRNQSRKVTERWWQLNGTSSTFSSIWRNFIQVIIDINWNDEGFHLPLKRDKQLFFFIEWCLSLNRATCYWDFICCLSFLIPRKLNSGSLSFSFLCGANKAKVSALNFSTQDMEKYRARLMWPSIVTARSFLKKFITLRTNLFNKIREKRVSP